MIRRERRPITLIAAWLLMTAPLAAQAGTHADSLLEHLIGTWVLEGPMAGHQVIHDVTFAWVLGHEYVELHEVSRKRTATGEPEYEAIVYIVWDPRTRQYACLWLDNTAAGPFEPGGVGHAVAGDDSIPFVFRVSDTDGFRNTFVYDRRTDSWQWHMDNDSAGVLLPFARVTLTRR